jgi:hypothetical protein
VINMINMIHDFDLYPRVAWFCALPVRAFIAFPLICFPDGAADGRLPEYLLAIFVRKDAFFLAAGVVMEQEEGV